MSSVREVVSESFLEHEYLSKHLNDIATKTQNSIHKEKARKFDSFSIGTSSDEELGTSLKFLSKMLFDFFDEEKCFVFIDEYDKALNEILLTWPERDERQRGINFFKTLYGSVFKDNTCVAKGLLTGILTNLRSLHSSFNNFTEISMLDNDFGFAEYYGITESEAIEAMVKYELGTNMTIVGADERSTQEEIQYAMMDQIEAYYGNYTIPGFTEKFYNPESFYKALASIEGK